MKPARGPVSQRDCFCVTRSSLTVVNDILMRDEGMDNTTEWSGRLDRAFPFFFFVNERGGPPRKIVFEKRERKRQYGAKRTFFLSFMGPSKSTYFNFRTSALILFFSFFLANTFLCVVVVVAETRRMSRGGDQKYTCCSGDTHSL